MKIKKIYFLILISTSFSISSKFERQYSNSNLQERCVRQIQVTQEVQRENIIGQELSIDDRIELAQNFLLSRVVKLLYFSFNNVKDFMLFTKFFFNKLVIMNSTRK